jgi:glyoxylase-like metal-dependent hydrolase (beta-lactamase superfamily II)
MTHHRLITRRVVLKDMGKAGLAFAVLGLAACSGDEGGATTTISSPTSTAAPDPPATTSAPTPDTTEGLPAEISYHRVVLGTVSAYVLYRGGEAVLVDTGNNGSESDIEAGLTAIGLDWGAVGHIVVTHKHPDHIGSLSAVVTAAPDAKVYAGLPDIPAMLDVVEPTPVATGDMVFDMEIIETPGHTAGHISVLDPNSSLLVVGDAMVNVNGELSGSFPQFTENMTMASSTVKSIAQLDFETALFGHGDPILTGASEAVRALAAGVS